LMKTKGAKMKISDGRCERHIFDKNLKSKMKFDGKNQDRMRRCSKRADWYDPKTDEHLCTIHFNLGLKAMIQSR